MSIQDKIDSGFLSRSAELYHKLGCCILQRIIEDRYSTREELAERLRLIDSEKDKGTAKHFLKDHQNDIYLSMLSQLDMTNCCNILDNSDISFTNEQKKAIEDIRRGRNSKSHLEDTSVTSDVLQKSVWKENRGYLRTLSREFPSYTPIDIRAQIDAYYNGTAGEYRPPGESIEKIYQTAIAEGRFADALNYLAENNRLDLAVKDSLRYERQFLFCIREASWKRERGLKRAAIIQFLELVRYHSRDYALKYSEYLDKEKRAIFLSEAFKDEQIEESDIVFTRVCESLDTVPFEKREQLARQIWEIKPEWKAPLQKIFLQERAQVRRGAAAGIKKKIDLLCSNLEEHIDDINGMDWVNPTKEMISWSTNSNLPAAFRRHCMRTEEEQILAVLEKDSRGTRLERFRCWIDYQKNPRIIHSDIASVQTAVLQFGENVSSEFWLQGVKSAEKNMAEPYDKAKLDNIKHCWDTDENNNVICISRNRAIQYISYTVPEYKLFSDAWFRFRTCYSHSYWKEEQRRINEASRLPFGPEKMAVTQDSDYSYVMDTGVAEYEEYMKEWQNFNILRTREYWTEELNRLQAVRSIPYCEEKENYTRSEMYDEVLVTGLAEETAWKTAYSQLKDELFKERGNNLRI